MKNVSVIGLILACFSGFLCCAEEVAIRVQKKHSLRSLLSPHVEPSITLIVGTNKVHDVVGNPPYYLRIPNRDWIFVSSETKDHHFFYYVINMQSGQKIDIDGRASDFGYWIGTTNGSSQEYIDIEAVSEKQLILTRKHGHRRLAYTIDLATKRATSMRIEDLDSEGKVIDGATHDLD